MFIQIEKCYHACMFVCYDTWMEVRGQLVRVVLAFCSAVGSEELPTDHQGCIASALPTTKPSPWIGYIFNDNIHFCL